MENNSSFQSSPFGMEAKETQQGPKPNNFLALSIVGTVLGLCNCIGLITGIIAIVYATQSTKQYQQGNYKKSVSSAKYAKILAWVTIGIFVLSMIRVYFNIQSMGGWDSMIEQIKDVIAEAEAANQ